ncbi:MAG: mRNA 3'-end processing factor [Halobacteriales archaeon]|nr:mRNA 3'-end processing factor [Halobacteriales archaeon]
MGPTVRLRDGVHVEGDRTVVCDARSAAGDVTVVSHAHADHARRGDGDPVVCSALTAALLEARSGVDVEHRASAPGVELRPAGHIPGSRAALIEGDRRVLYTGDVSTRDRGPLQGFEPVGADVLIVEATYGRPAYRFAPQAELEARIREFVADTDDPLALFGYSLGRAQTLCRLVDEATSRRLVVHPTVHAVNEVLEAERGRTFDAVPWTELDALAADDVVVAPSGARRGEWFAGQLDRLEPVTAAFSGWAVDESYRYRVGVDEAFVLTDHCGFDELVALVQAVDPERVYTHHGFAEEFADHLASAHGYDAVALRRGQRRLEEYA